MKGRKGTFSPSIKSARAKATGGRKLTDEELKTLHDVTFRTYVDLLDACGRLGLTPFLCAGSLLGAVRHGGFIPWDDDFDVAMTREEFEILKSNFKVELGDKYVLSARGGTVPPRARFPKIMRRGTVAYETGFRPHDDPILDGIYVDVFVIDSVPDSNLAFKVKGTIANVLEFVSGCVYDEERLDAAGRRAVKRASKVMYVARTFAGKLCSPIPSSRWFEIVDSFVASSAETRRRGLLTGSRHYFGEVFPKNVFFPAKSARFNGTEAPIFGKAKRYLRNAYGDYMKIPPESERTTHSIRFVRISDEVRNDLKEGAS